MTNVESTATNAFMSFIKPVSLYWNLSSSLFLSCIWFAYAILEDNYLYLGFVNIQIFVIQAFHELVSYGMASLIALCTPPYPWLKQTWRMYISGAGNLNEIMISAYKM